MNKLPLRQQLIKKMVVDMAIPQSTIEAVISHQFQSAVKAMESNFSVEISGFGRFTYNKKRALKMITTNDRNLRDLNAELASEDISPTRKLKVEMKIGIISSYREMIVKKIGYEDQLATGV